MRPQLKTRSAGSYTVRIELSDPQTGRRKQKRITIRAAGKKEAEAELTRILARERHLMLSSTSPTFEEYALRWIASKNDIEPTTYGRYEGLIHDHLIPELGHVRVQRIAVADVKRAVAIWRGKKRKDRRKGNLSSASVRHAFDLLRKILNDAVEEEIITINPCKQMKAPRSEKRKVRGFDLDGVRKMLDKIAESPFFLIVLVAVGTGLRRGEQLALRWIDVSLESALLSVNQTVVRVKDLKTAQVSPKSTVVRMENGYYLVFRPKAKTDKSLRTLPLPGFVVEALRLQLEQQQAYFAEIGAQWTPNTLVFTDEYAMPWDPNRVSTAAKSLCERSGYPEASLHVMRHSQANVQRETGADTSTIRDILGHASTATTDIYTDPSLVLMQAAASNVERVLGPTALKLLASLPQHESTREQPAAPPA